MTEEVEDKSAWSDDRWAEYINAREANPVLAIIERGKRLKERRDDCDQKGDRVNTFAAFCKERLRISRDMAYKLIAISGMESRIPVVYNSLPASWRTLYELSRLTDTEFDDVMKAGKIHPEMTRAEAQALRGKAVPPVEVSSGVVGDEESLNSLKNADKYEALFKSGAHLFDFIEEGDGTPKERIKALRLDKELQEVYTAFGEINSIKSKHDSRTFLSDFLDHAHHDYLIFKGAKRLFKEIATSGDINSAILQAEQEIREAERDLLREVEEKIKDLGKKAMSKFKAQVAKDTVINSSDPRVAKLLTRAVDEGSAPSERMTAIQAIKRIAFSAN